MNTQSICLKEYPLDSLRLGCSYFMDVVYQLHEISDMYYSSPEYKLVEFKLKEFFGVEK